MNKQRLKKNPQDLVFSLKMKDELGWTEKNFSEAFWSPSLLRRQRRTPIITMKRTNITSFHCIQITKYLADIIRTIPKSKYSIVCIVLEEINKNIYSTRRGLLAFPIQKSSHESVILELKSRVIFFAEMVNGSWSDREARRVQGGHRVRPTIESLFQTSKNIVARLQKTNILFTTS